MPFLLLSSSSRVIIGRKMSCSSKWNRLDGSCISTLVSRTKILEWICDFRAIGNPLFKRLDEINHFLSMTGNLHAAPLAPQHAIAVDDEGAALDAPDLFTIHTLHFDDAEQIAGGFFLVAKQLERQILFRLEILV